MSDREITGAVVATARKSAALSREKFAQQVGITPGAVWRIEAKNQFKPGEHERISAWLNGQQMAPQTHPQAQKTPVTVVDAEDVSQPLLGVVEPPVFDFSLDFKYVDPPKITLPSLGESEESPTAMSERDGLWRVSNSEVQTWKRCRRKWWLTYYRRLQRTYESPVGARAIGTRVHDALRYAYLADPDKRMDPRDALEALIFADYQKLSQNLDSHGEFESTQDLIKRFQKEADLERIMIAGYVTWLEETGADSELEIIGSEVYLEAEVPEVPNTLLIARLDARVRRVTDGVRLFIDHKTVGDFTQPAKTLHMDEQMLMYILIERLQADESYVAGALYNMLKKSKRTQKATPPFFKRIEVHHNNHTLENFRERLIGTLDSIRQARFQLDSGDSHRRVVYPTPRRDCPWDCPFFDVCGMMDDGSYAEGMIKQFFTVGDPHSYYVRGQFTSQSPDLT